MRIQILPLPTQRTGDTEHTPFIVLIDQLAEDDATTPGQGYPGTLSIGIVEQLRISTGAQAAIVSRTITAPGRIELTTQQLHDLHAHLQDPNRTITIPSTQRTK